MDIKSLFRSIPTITKNLIIVNVIMWLATIVFMKTAGINLEQMLGLHYWRGSDFNPIQFFTYMFMHDSTGLAHIFFNMFSLWMFGMTLERVLGGKRFLFYYVSCGLGAAVIQELVWEFTWKTEFLTLLAEQNGQALTLMQQYWNQGMLADYAADYCNMLVTVGASGAVFGILLAFGMLFPNLPMYIIPFPFPIKAKWMVLGYGAIELLFGIGGIMSGVAHFAHLGGMLFGFIMIKYWKHNGKIGGYHGFY